MNLDYEEGFRAGKRDARRAMERRIAEAIISERNRCLSACASEFLTHRPKEPIDIAHQTAVEHCIASIMEDTLNV